MSPTQHRQTDLGGIVSAPRKPALTESPGAMNTLSGIPPNTPSSRKDLSSGLGLCYKRTLVIFIAIFIIVLIIVFLHIFKVIDLIGPTFPDLNLKA